MRTKTNAAALQRKARLARTRGVKALRFAQEIVRDNANASAPDFTDYSEAARTTAAAWAAIKRGRICTAFRTARPYDRVVWSCIEDTVEFLLETTSRDRADAFARRQNHGYPSALTCRRVSRAYRVAAQRAYSPLSFRKMNENAGRWAQAADHREQTANRIEVRG